MRKLHLVGVCPKRWRTTTVIDHADAYPVDAAKRDWDKGELNRVWVGDITYLRTWEGWLYLATVIDAHSRRVIGWAIDEHMRADLVQDALAMAITLRGDLPAKVVFHSDAGSQGLGPDHRVRHSQRADPIHGINRYLLGQRHGRIVLRNVEDRVLLPTGLAGQEAGPDRGRQVDRGSVQPASPARLDRSDQPGGLRTAILTPDRGLSKSRITRVHETGAEPLWLPLIRIRRWRSHPSTPRSATTLA